MRIGWAIDMQFSPISFLHKSMKSNTITDDVMNRTGNHLITAELHGRAQVKGTKQKRKKTEQRVGETLRGGGVENFLLVR